MGQMVGVGGLTLFRIGGSKMEEVREPYNKLQLTAKLNVLSRCLRMKCLL
jgi:hypothetical protein